MDRNKATRIHHPQIRIAKDYSSLMLNTYTYNVLRYTTIDTNVSL